MDSEIATLRNRILPILLFCQANKGDLWPTEWDDWKTREDASKKLFYAYYSGVFCRILCQLEDQVDYEYLQQCNDLLDKYNWYNLQEYDLQLFRAERDPYYCEVPKCYEFIDGVDNVAWINSGVKNGTDAVCLKMADGERMTFADVRGSVRVYINTSTESTDDLTH